MVDHSEGLDNFPRPHKVAGVAYDSPVEGFAKPSLLLDNEKHRQGDGYQGKQPSKSRKMLMSKIRVHSCLLLTYYVIFRPILANYRTAVKAQGGNIIIFNNSQNDFDAVIIGRCPTSFATGKHHSKNAPLSQDKSAFFIAKEQ